MRTLIHKKNAVIFIHLISSKLYIERNNNKKLCKIKKKLSPALETLLNERKKNPVLMKVKKKTCSFSLLTFFDRMMIFLLNCDGRSKCIFARKNLALTEFGITMERNCWKKEKNIKEKKQRTMKRKTTKKPTQHIYLLKKQEQNNTFLRPIAY